MYTASAQHCCFSLLFSSLVFQQVIADITRRMGAGMAEFIEREVESLRDYDLYCHYVAGLVGLGLTEVLLDYSRTISALDSLHV